MGVADLKKELLSKGLKATGKKADLVERIKAAANGNGGKVEQPKEEEQEETDFSKAKRALVAEIESKKKSKAGKKQRRVDPYIPCAGSREVYEDWGCMLNQTNIRLNINEFYVIQLLKTGMRYNLWTRWGRVGEQGQSSMGRASDLEAVKKRFMKKFSDLTKNKWENRDNFKAVPGKYTLLEMDDDFDGDEYAIMVKMKALDGTGPAPTTLPCTLDKPTQALVKFIFENDLFWDALEGLKIHTKQLPLGKLSNVQIAKGLGALENIKKAIDANNRCLLTDLSSKFYTIIPHDFGHYVPPVIGDKQILQTKLNMLLVNNSILALYDIEIAEGMQAKDKGKIEATKMPHELDIYYQSLNCDLTHVDPNSHEYDVISKYITETGGDCLVPKILELWRVDRHKVDDRFKVHDAITNRRLLWHGTNLTAVADILKSGLRIMPHKCGRVGKGIYLASEFSNSFCYVEHTADDTCIMFLNEVVLGKEYHITKDNRTLKAPPKGYDSVTAKRRTEPDPKDDIVMKMGGKDVTVPQGKPIPTSVNTSEFYQSEYIIYKESQIRIRYMLKMQL